MCVHDFYGFRNKQVLLPLRGALDNLRLLAFEDECRADPQDGPMDNRMYHLLAAQSQHDAPDNRTIGQRGNTMPGEGGGRNDCQRCVKHWRSLQGAISGVYPVVDKRGRVSHTERERVSIRLRLSVLLPLKKVRSGGEKGCRGRTHTGMLLEALVQKINAGPAFELNTTPPILETAV